MTRRGCVAASLGVLVLLGAAFGVARELRDRDDGLTTTSASDYYRVDGELFFASSNDLTTQFEYAADPARVVIDLSRTHVWDASTVAALDAIVTKYEQRGTSVELEGMSEAAAKFHGRLSGGLGSAG